jgi:hypothetical protein
MRVYEWQVVGAFFFCAGFATALATVRVYDWAKRVLNFKRRTWF